MAGIGAFPSQRTHTLYFLDELRAASPVFLDTEVDMSGVTAHRTSGPRRYSVVSYVLRTAAAVLARHPDATTAVRGGWRPAVAPADGVHGKVTLDRELDGQRVVLAAVLRDLQDATLDRVQDELERYRDHDPSELAEFDRLRTLHRLPPAVGRLVYRRVVRPLANRSAAFGTFSVTSLGHRAVDGFHSMGGTTVTLGVGRVLDRPVARDGRVVIAPTMRLSMAFDHRAIDGAEAADVLHEIRDGLQAIAPEQVPAEPVTEGVAAG